MARAARPGAAGSAPERVAGGRVARLEPLVEPLGPLLGRAVGPRLRVDADAGARLDPVVTDGGRRAQAFLEVARLEVALLVDGLCPHAGEAVGLELHLDRELVLPARVLLLELADLALDPRHRLDVVPDLVRDDIRLREVARRPEAVAKLLEEVRVQVDLPV